MGDRVSARLARTPLPGMGRQLLAATNPALGGRVGAFRRAAAAVPATANGRRVAVIGRSPRGGTSTVAALVALIAAAYTDNRVVVLDASGVSPRIPGRPGPHPDRPGPHADQRGPDPAGRSVGALLGGTGEGRLPVLLAVADGEVVARSLVRAAGTPGASVPVLALPGAARFTPQVLAQTLDRLRLRADLIVIDTPTDPDQPLFHAVLNLVDHVLLVIPADRHAPDRLEAARTWLAAVPGPLRLHEVSVALVVRRTSVPRWRPDDLPWTLLRRDAALAAGTVGKMSRGSALRGLEILTRVARPLPQSTGSGW